MKRLNSYFPIWLLMVMPPLIVITVIYNFIAAAIGLLIFLFVIDIKGIFETYSKNIFKIWGIGILLDIITFVLLFIPELLHKNNFFNKNLIIPLETNPYSKVLSFIYIVLVLIINILIAYFFIKKIFMKNNKNIKNIKLKMFIIIIFIIPYLFFIPSNLIIKNKYVSLEDYKGTIMNNKDNVSAIIKHLETTKYLSSYVIDTHSEPYTLNLYLKNIDSGYILMFEKDASVLLNLIDDVNEINFYMNEIQYSYTVNDINEIFTDIRRIKFNEIALRYKDKKFDDYNYLGRIKSYDVFDTSDFCNLDKQLLFTYEDEDYYLSCTKIEQILLYNDKENYNIKEALDKKIITIDDILASNLQLTSEKKNS